MTGIAKNVPFAFKKIALSLKNAFPTEETTQKIYHELDLQPATQAYMDFYPAFIVKRVIQVRPLNDRLLSTTVPTKSLETPPFGGMTTVPWQG